MRLDSLAAADQGIRFDPAAAALDITGLTADSRAVAPGFLFAALQGVKEDGIDFIPEALGRGAVAALLRADAPQRDYGLALLRAENPRRGLARMAARFHGRQPETIVAVTGTNGKTSVAHFTRQIWAGLGHQAASLGTLGLAGPGVHRPESLTTPDPVLLHAVLAETAAAGVTHLAMEASSHGLAQYRLDGVRMKAAAFTNLSRDHLDYHGDMAAYLAAKARLFGEVLADGGTAVLNADVSEFPVLAGQCRERGLSVIDFGYTARRLRLLKTDPHGSGQWLTIDLDGATFMVDLPLIGTFQGMNALCALGLVIAAGAQADAAVPLLNDLSGVPGRVEHVASVGGGEVYVDYAHTPDALETVLKAMRPHCAGRLTIVFGAGGDRDRGKRAPMGAAASRLADRVIVTDDNPRSEDPAVIRAEVLAGCPGAEEIGDRRAAIAAGIAALGEGDLLLIAGKGHERGQTVGAVVHPFHDGDVAREIAMELGP